jgi:hypothetical protein
MPINPSDAEISAMLDMLAEDSSDSIPVETIAIATVSEPKNTLTAQKSEGVRAGSPSHTSMDVHVGSSPPHSDCMAATRASN